MATRNGKTGKFVSDDPKIERMRVTKAEKKLFKAVRMFRQWKEAYEGLDDLAVLFVHRFVNENISEMNLKELVDFYDDYDPEDIFNWCSKMKYSDHPKNNPYRVEDAVFYYAACVSCDLDDLGLDWSDVC